ncbi:HPF/RaiA family ribosome-associated protein [bacterium]|nr:HPF/RaiA family ribosome-associated protein [bacterium]
MKITFRNLDRSDFAKEAIISRIETIHERFPDLMESNLHITVDMENSSLQPGPDLFKVKVRCRGGRYDGVILEKSGENFFLALAEVVEHFLERLNRFGDRARDVKRRKARLNGKGLRRSMLA